MVIRQRSWRSKQFVGKEGLRPFPLKRSLPQTSLAFFRADERTGDGPTDHQDGRDGRTHEQANVATG